MAIKRISELDLFHLSTLKYANITLNAEKNDYIVNDTTKILDTPHLMDRLNDYVLLEISLSCNHDNEAPSYYISKKVPCGELYNLFFGDWWRQLTLILSGHLILGQPNADGVDYLHGYKYDNKPYIDLPEVDENGSIVPEIDPSTGKPKVDPDTGLIVPKIKQYDRVLSCLVKSYFANDTQFHHSVKFHNAIWQQANQAWCNNHKDDLAGYTAKEVYGGGSGTIFSSTQKAATFSLLGGEHNDPAFRVRGYAQFDCPIDGIAMSAWWADLAEKYRSDFPYDPGTLVKFGGEKEITIADDKVNGVVTTAPGLMLNSFSEDENDIMVGMTLAGRVPVKVLGPVKKFDRIVLSKTS